VQILSAVPHASFYLSHPSVTSLLAAMLWARPWLQAVPALFLQGFLLIGAVSGVVLVFMAVIEAINQQVGGKSAVPAPDEVLP